jgi:hypothetical protein
MFVSVPNHGFSVLNLIPRFWPWSQKMAESQSPLFAPTPLFLPIRYFSSVTVRIRRGFHFVLDFAKEIFPFLCPDRSFSSSVFGDWSPGEGSRSVASTSIATRMLRATVFAVGRASALQYRQSVRHLCAPLTGMHTITMPGIMGAKVRAMHRRTCYK